ncbi:MAG TPA: BamA/TamA family outer membrane protein, partial [Gemmatimonadaceae bacterium]
TLRQPSIFGGHWTPAYSVYTERRGEFRAYLRTTYIGGEASATRNIGDRMPLRVGYSLEYGDTHAEPVFLCAIFSRCDKETQDAIQARLPFAVASVSFQRNRLDNLVAPRSGYSFATEARTSAPFLGSNEDLTFFKLTGDFSLYRPVTSRITFTTRFRAGVVTLGRTAGTKLPPPQERLYAGGANSVRGFQQNELGALVYLVDSSSTDTVRVAPDSLAFVAKDRAGARRTIPVGGNTLGVLNVELRVRDPFIPELLEYVPFLDAGQLFTEGGTQVSNLKRVYVTPGLGIRYYSPVGPLQLNAGYNPSKTRAGPAYWSPRIDEGSNKAPLICVTGPGAPLSPVHIDENRNVDEGSTSCPDSFVPFRSNSFFSRLTWTFSIVTSF